MVLRKNKNEQTLDQHITARFDNCGFRRAHF